MSVATPVLSVCLHGVHMEKLALWSAILVDVCTRTENERRVQVAGMYLIGSAVDSSLLLAKISEIITHH
jgi:hypothetical protein